VPIGFRVRIAENKSAMIRRAGKIFCDIFQLSGWFIVLFVTATLKYLMY